MAPRSAHEGILLIHRSAGTISLTVLSGLLLAGSLTGCDTAARAEPHIAGTESAAALAQLETIPVKGRAPKTGYSRDGFGPAWADVDRNGCDTRNDILARDLEGETFKPGTQDCVVATGTLADRYTGTTITFVRGNTSSSAVQIDHIVALSDAWQKGAEQWDAQTRRNFAN